ARGQMNPDTIVSDLFLAKLEANVARYEQIKSSDFGLGIESRYATEFHRLPAEQSKIRKRYIKALQAEGKTIKQTPDDLLDAATAAKNEPELGLRVKCAAERTEIFLYGGVGTDFTSDDLRRELQQLPAKQPVTLRVNSDGGSYTEGVAVHSIIASHTALISARVDSLACSAASFMIMGCQPVVMESGSMMMIHQVSASL